MARWFQVLIQMPRESRFAHFFIDSIVHYGIYTGFYKNLFYKKMRLESPQNLRTYRGLGKVKDFILDATQDRGNSFFCLC